MLMQNHKSCYFQIKPRLIYNHVTEFDLIIHRIQNDSCLVLLYDGLAVLLHSEDPCVPYSANNHSSRLHRAERL